MSLNAQDIARIANLARLELHPGESERMLAQINGFFAIVEKMRAVDTSGVEPLTHPVATVQGGGSLLAVASPLPVASVGPPNPARSHGGSRA